MLADHRGSERDEPLHLGVDLVVLGPAAIANVDVEVHHVGQELLVGSSFANLPSSTDARISMPGGNVPRRAGRWMLLALVSSVRLVV